MKISIGKKSIKNNIAGLAVIFTTTLFTSVALANTNSPAIDHKQQNQKQRIIQGVNSGELTGQEAWRLGKQQGKIYHKEQRLKSDDQFTARERAVIHRDLLKSSRSIYLQKRDFQTQEGAKTGLRSPGINQRQFNQHRRITQGVHSGELTRPEAARLRHQQAHINHQEKRFKADGAFNARERAKVHKSQNRASKNIYRKKHNARTR